MTFFHFRGVLDMVRNAFFLDGQLNMLEIPQHASLI